ncbi:MAG: DUF3769 domain-containing protein [Cyanobacteria bacterium P01_E01_bin.45]
MIPLLFWLTPLSIAQLPPLETVPPESPPGASANSLQADGEASQLLPSEPLDGEQSPNRDSNPVAQLDTEPEVDTEPGAESELDEQPTETNISPELVPSPDLDSATGTPTGETALPENALQIRSDRQTFNSDTQIFTAEGNVEMVFGQTILNADTVTMNLVTEIATAEGNVVIKIDERQEVRGTYLEYNTGDQTGYLDNAEGELDIVNLPVSIQRATLSTDAVATSVFDTPSSRPNIKFVRFEADRINLTPENWTATNVAVTNDPEGPPRGPELERRSETAVLEELPNGASLLTMRGSSLWFDRKFRLPLRDNQIVIGDDSVGRRPPFDVLFDDDDGGLILRRNLELLGQRNIAFTVAPRLRVQQFGNEDGILAAFGLDLEFNRVSPGKQVTDIFVALNSLAFASGVDDEIRARIQHRIPVGTNRGNVVLRYAYRPRFRPIFGEVDTRTDLFHEAGVAYNSPRIDLGNSGISFSSRIAGDYLDGESRDDRLEFVQVGRLRADAALSGRFPLWQVDVSDRPQPRFSFAPIEQGFWAIAGLRTNAAAYTTGDIQTSLIGSIGFQTVLGEFDRNFFDYTAFNLIYSNGVVDDDTPLRFDRFRSRETVRLGLRQQLYGPFRIGAETRIRLDEGFEELDTLYSISYDRRTYGIDISFSLISQSGSFRVRIDDFNIFDAGVGLPEGTLQ